jgi:hypothetical protein
MHGVGTTSFIRKARSAWESRQPGDISAHTADENRIRALRNRGIGTKTGLRVPWTGKFTKAGGDGLRPIDIEVLPRTRTKHKRSAEAAGLARQSRGPRKALALVSRPKRKLVAAPQKSTCAR